MEQLDHLESLMGSMAAEIEALRKEVLQLREESAGHVALVEEHNNLKQAFEKEKKLKDTVLKRIDELVTHFDGIASRHG